jgi:hypothetical protein
LRRCSRSNRKFDCIEARVISRERKINERGFKDKGRKTEDLRSFIPYPSSSFWKETIVSSRLKELRYIPGIQVQGT